jgi:phosphatidylinositol glycan class V
MVLTVMVVFFMHVQIITRFFTALPTVYWYAAHLILNTRHGRIVLAYFVLYASLTSVLFGCFLPPA